MRWLLVGVLTLGASSLATAQPRPEDVKKLEVEVDNLRAQLKAMEAKLQHAKELLKKDLKKEDKKEEKKDGKIRIELWGGPGFGGWKDLKPEEMKELREQLEKMRKEFEKGGIQGFRLNAEEMKKFAEQFEKGGGKSGFGGGWGRGGWGRGGPGGGAWGGSGPGRGWGRRGEEPKAETKPSSDIEKRLDKIIQEVEALKKELRKK